MEQPDDFTEIMEKKFKKDLLENDITAAAGTIKDYFEKLDHVTLKIAITGESGSGKSTFVNAYRGLGGEDEGSAPTGCVETTFEPTAYPHLGYPNVQLWDLPGIGTPNFKAQNYLKQVQFDRYEFFIIISTDRFKENDVKLALEIQKNKKKFYFVRSKIDSSLESEAKSKKSFNEEATKKEIKDNCIKGLMEQGITSPNVFLISSFDLEKYDFPALVRKLEEDLPSHKRDALLMSLPNISIEIQQKKKTSLQSRIWKVAVLSGLGGLIPFPGYSIVVDTAILVQEVNLYYKAFGLDPKSMKSLAERLGKNEEELRAVLKSPLNKGINIDVMLKLLISAGATGTAIAVEQGLHFLPIIGSVLAGCLSYRTTYNMLDKCLNDLADDAQNVLIKVLDCTVTAV